MGTSVTVETDQVAGPASYAAGGFTVSTGLSTVNWFEVTVATRGANLPASVFNYTLNSPSAGQVTVKVYRVPVDEFASGETASTLTGLPSGVTSQSTSGQSYDNEQAHTHGFTHDHGSVTSGTPANGTAGVNVAVGGPSEGGHTHGVNPPSFSPGSGIPEAVHAHTWDNLYQHGHTVTNTTTDCFTTELAAGTNLSGTSFDYVAVK